MLSENQIAYSLDAIEIFLSLNKELGDVEKVKMSHKSSLPLFPDVPENKRKQFLDEYLKALSPDLAIENTFKSLRDSLRIYSNSINTAGPTRSIIVGVINSLNTFSSQLSNTNQVSVGLLNGLVSEIINLLQTNKISDKNNIERLKGISSNITGLVSYDNSLSRLNPVSNDHKYSTGFYHRTLTPSIAQYKLLDNYFKKNGNELHSGYRYLPPLKKQLLPFDVVVWKYSKEEPSRAVTNMPDLNEVYRIFYTTSVLYNSKNPEVNAKTTPHLASTASIFLPSNSIYKIWATNMVTHQTTKPFDIDINDLFLLDNKKNNPGNKNYKIILKGY